MNTYQCINDMISDDERKQLLSQAMNIKMWSYKISDYKLEESCGIIKLNIEGIVKKLVNRVNPTLKFFMADFGKFSSKETIAIHKDTDTVSGRDSNITWALYPELKDFSPIQYWNEDKTFNEVVNYEKKPLIVNTKKYHSVDNTSEYDRYTFQLCFYDPIEKLVDLDLQGKLFI